MLCRTDLTAKNWLYSLCTIHAAFFCAINRKKSVPKIVLSDPKSLYILNSELATRAYAPPSLIL